jgi:hypothetical protein
MAQMKISVVPFPVPFEVRLDLPGAKVAGPTINIADLDDQTLEELCEEFVKAVYARKKEKPKASIGQLDGHNA